MEWLWFMAVRSRMRTKASSATWHKDNLPTSCVGKGSLNNPWHMGIIAIHASKMCIGDSTKSVSKQSLHSMELFRFAIFRCLFHQPWPVKNWMHLPRYSLDKFINFAARWGSGIVNQYLVWLWPFKLDHSFCHNSSRWVFMVGMILFLFGTTKRFSYVVFPLAYSNQS